MKFKRSLILLVSFILSILFFTSDFALIDIEKTAIIVALGIDKKNDGIEITAQIGVPHATEQALDNSDTIIYATGKTVMEAIDNLKKSSGWFPKLSFCSVIIFGMEIANQDISNICDHLLSSEKFQNSALLAISDTSAKKLLSTTTPLDSISSFAIQKVLLENDISSTSVLDTNLKKFSQWVHGKSNCGYIPLIKAVSGMAEGEEESSSAITTSKNTSKYLDNRPIDQLFEILPLEETSSGSDQSKPTAVFDASKTCIIKNGKIVDVLTKSETIAYNLLKMPADRIILPVKTDDANLSLEVFGSKKSITLTFDKRPTLNLNLSLTVRLQDSQGGQVNQEDKSLGRRATVPEEYLNSLKNQITDTLTILSDRLLKNDVDLFEIRERLYKYHNKNYNDYKKIPLSDYAININVKVVSKDSNK